VNSALPINNATWLASPPASARDLRERCQSAAGDARSFALPWVLYLFEPEIPAPVLAEADAISESLGLKMTGHLRVMLGDVAPLPPPLHPLPNVDMVRVTSRDDAWAALDLNPRAYGMPPFITASVVESGAYFRDREREFGFLALSGG